MCSLFVFIIFSLFVKIQSNAEDVENLVVRVQEGLLQGQRIQSANRGSYISFKGVPYAKPPTGSLRFKDPEPLEPWEGVRNASSHGNLCLQPLPGFMGVFGDEDCLFLNVYSLKLHQRRSARRPVMVWIHGGGYSAGSGNSDVYGPDYLVSEDVVVVTINYRLGPLGFIYLDEAAPGNVGMKDMVAALRWIQRNIAVFGGDPGKVTVFGESSGGSSAHFLMLSPMAKGLFSSAISQSGHAVYRLERDPIRQATLRLADLVGCNDSSATAIVDCLRQLNASTLVDATNTLFRETDQILPFAFRPVVDLKVENVPVFLPTSPIKIIMDGNQHPVPFMNGFTDKEGYYLLRFDDIYNESVARKLDASWNKSILSFLRLPVNGSRNEEASQALRNFYLDGKPLTNETVPGFLDMITDIFFGEGTSFAMRQMAKNHRAPVYEYCFTVDDVLNVEKSFISVNFTGASHADDLGYLFRLDILPDVSSNSSAALARSRMVRLWTNFAKYGTPTPRADPVLNTNWSQYTNRRKDYLEIGSALRASVNLNEARATFWKNFYRTYSSINDQTFF